MKPYTMGIYKESGSERFRATSELVGRGRLSQLRLQEEVLETRLPALSNTVAPVGLETGERLAQSLDHLLVTVHPFSHLRAENAHVALDDPNQQLERLEGHKPVGRHGGRSDVRKELGEEKPLGVFGNDKQRALDLPQEEHFPGRVFPRPRLHKEPCYRFGEFRLCENNAVETLGDGAEGGLAVSVHFRAYEDDGGAKETEDGVEEDEGKGTDEVAGAEVEEEPDLPVVGEDGLVARIRRLLALVARVDDELRELADIAALLEGQREVHLLEEEKSERPHEGVVGRGNDDEETPQEGLQVELLADVIGVQLANDHVDEEVTLLRCGVARVVDRLTSLTSLVDWW